MMYTVSARRGAKVELYAFPELVSELRSAGGVLWRCQPAKAKVSPQPPEAA